MNGLRSIKVQRSGHTAGKNNAVKLVRQAQLTVGEVADDGNTMASGNHAFADTYGFNRYAGAPEHINGSNSLGLLKTVGQETIYHNVYLRK